MKAIVVAHGKTRCLELRCHQDSSRSGKRQEYQSKLSPSSGCTAFATFEFVNQATLASPAVLGHEDVDGAKVDHSFNHNRV